MIWKLSAVLTIFVMVAFPFRGVMAKDAGCSCALKTSYFGVGGLLLTQSTSRNDYFLKFSQCGRKLFDADCAFRTHKPESAVGVPFSGCRTLLAYCFSGGAHCCTTLFLATSCGPGSSLDMADLADDQGKVKFIRVGEAPGKEIEVHDWQFAYYGSPDLKMQFTFADSPAMVRLLVFRAGHWRVDRAGEFRLFYSRLLRETVKKARAAARRKKTDATASLAMEAAYYELMAGASPGLASEVLYRLLPPGFKSEKAGVMQDIRRAVSGFDPVEPVSSKCGLRKLN